jgi:hypothetical protein
VIVSSEPWAFINSTIVAVKANPFAPTSGGSIRLQHCSYTRVNAIGDDFCALLALGHSLAGVDTTAVPARGVGSFTIGHF